jgi:hypothetical protein
LENKVLEHPLPVILLQDRLSEDPEDLVRKLTLEIFSIPSSAAAAAAWEVEWAAAWAEALVAVELVDLLLVMISGLIWRLISRLESLEEKKRSAFAIWKNARLVAEMV